MNPSTLAKAKAQTMASDTQKQFVTMKINNQFFALSVHVIQDVLPPQKLTRIPLAPPEIAGALNLRGRIVTSINMRARLGLPALDDAERCKSIVVEHLDRLYSLVVDSVGEVLTLPIKDCMPPPENMPPEWQRMTQGVFPLKDSLLILLDVEKLLHFGGV